MKKCQLMIAALLTISTLNGFATDKEKAAGITNESAAVLNIEKASDKAVYRLVYQSKVEGLVKVSIYNAQGSLLLKDQIQNTTGFCRPYNFEELPIGNYTVKIEDATGKTTKSIHYGGEVIESIEANTLKVSVQAVEENFKYAVKVIGSLQSPIEVRIYDATATMIFTEVITETKSFSKVYDLSKTGLESMTFEIRNENGVIKSTTF